MCGARGGPLIYLGNPLRNQVPVSTETGLEASKEQRGLLLPEPPRRGQRCLFQLFSSHPSKLPSQVGETSLLPAPVGSQPVGNLRRGWDWTSHCNDHLFLLVHLLESDDLHSQRSCVL